MKKEYRVWCEKCDRWRNIRDMPDRNKSETHFLIKDNRGHWLSPLEENESR